MSCRLPAGLHSTSIRGHDLLVSTGNRRRAVQAYLASITFSDAMLGRILDALGRSLNRDNTIVVLWSDHGYHPGEKWHWHKQSLWQRATHVPQVISAPGITRAGCRCDRPVGLVDLYPTLCELAGLNPPEGLDGVSLRPVLENPGRDWDRPAITTYGRGNHAIRTERWSYIRYHDGSEELYDRRQDVQEWINLASSAAFERTKELQRWLPSSEAPGESVPACRGRRQPRFGGRRAAPMNVAWVRIPDVRQIGQQRSSTCIEGRKTGQPHRRIATGWATSGVDFAGAPVTRLFKVLPSARCNHPRPPRSDPQQRESPRLVGISRIPPCVIGGGAAVALSWYHAL